jgi:hypothetical protein
MPTFKLGEKVNTHFLSFYCGCFGKRLKPVWISVGLSVFSAVSKTNVLKSSVELIVAIINGFFWTSHALFLDCNMPEGYLHGPLLNCSCFYMCRSLLEVHCWWLMHKANSILVI